jgi:hypothetical protein
MHHRRTTCRLCGAECLAPVLDLSPMPLANGFLRSPEEFAGERRFPLLVSLCERCGLVQTPDVITPETLFQEYPYLSGISATMAAHHRAAAAAVIERAELGPGDLVVEIASNDGSLLDAFRAAGLTTLGVEPARNIAARARSRGVDTVARFFDRALAAELLEARGPARAVLASNVLAHVDDPVDFLAGCRTLLGRGGLLVLEVPWVADLLAGLAWDTIYHEHLSYFSAGALLAGAGAAGLAVERIEHLPVHGGSLRVWATPAAPGQGHHDAALAWSARERAAGVGDARRWQRFSADADASRRALVGRLGELRASGARIAAYGAPAKGNTLLNWCRIGPELVEFTVDRSPLKVGRYTPGMHLPVRPVEALADGKPDHVLVLPWNLLDEIVQQEAGLRALGTRFLRPLPRVETVP